MKYNKLWAVVLLSLCLVFGMTACDKPSPTEGLSYELTEDGSSYLVIDIGSANVTALVIPDEYNNLPVTGVDAVAFYQCESLTKVFLPDTITFVGEKAFDGCNIQEATIPAVACSSIASPDLKKVTITSGAIIGSGAFQRCESLSSITIPDSVTSIGGYAFDGCESLTSITFNGTKEQWRNTEKGYDWNSYTGNYTIHCTDGDITK